MIIECSRCLYPLQPLDNFWAKRNLFSCFGPNKKQLFDPFLYLKKLFWFKIALLYLFEGIYPMLGAACTGCRTTSDLQAPRTTPVRSGKHKGRCPKTWHFSIDIRWKHCPKTFHAIHRDACAFAFQDINVLSAFKLASQIGIEYFWTGKFAQGFLKNLCTPLCGHAVDTE